MAALIALTSFVIGLPIVAILVWRLGLEFPVAIFVGVWIFAMSLVRLVLWPYYEALFLFENRGTGYVKVW